MTSSSIKQIIGFFGVLLLMPLLLSAEGTYTERDGLLAVAVIGFIIFLVIFSFIYFLTDQGVILNREASKHERVVLSGSLSVLPSTLLVILLPAINFVDESRYIQSIPKHKVRVESKSCVLNFCTLELTDVTNGKTWLFSSFKGVKLKGDCYFLDTGVGSLGLTYMHNFFSCEEVRAFNGFRDVYEPTQ
ncbi:hypothetical protein [Pseudoalteromonas sp. T1lg48]|uniref:hypothetical protein n=1 Tax=Pseudoalteromonas sp. T1lg48 TaxID=2077100 RepID=UPI001319E60A|nr:hypothetical protein [Pseudoalteromonas sp. T1lg48]